MPSSVISSISYHLNEQSLTVVFHSGEVYRYEKVPEAIYKEFKAAASKGRYLNYKLKKLFVGKKIAP